MTHSRSKRSADLHKFSYATQVDGWKWQLFSVSKLKFSIRCFICGSEFNRFSASESNVTHWTSPRTWGDFGEARVIQFILTFNFFSLYLSFSISFSLYLARFLFLSFIPSLIHCAHDFCVPLISFHLQFRSFNSKFNQFSHSFNSIIFKSFSNQNELYSLISTRGSTWEHSTKTLVQNFIWRKQFDVESLWEPFLAQILIENFSANHKTVNKIDDSIGWAAIQFTVERINRSLKHTTPNTQCHTHTHTGTLTSNKTSIDWMAKNKLSNYCENGISNRNDVMMSLFARNAKKKRLCAICHVRSLTQME